jgi:hypothetical protein
MNTQTNINKDLQINYNEIGMMAKVGDVWYTIMDIRLNKMDTDTVKEYLLYSQHYWIPQYMIKEIKNKTWFKDNGYQ